MDSSVPPSRTALVVDDYQPVLTLLQRVLAGAGFNTTAVDQGRAAMTLLAEHRFDLLLVEANLPDMNGLRLCEAARERYQDQVVILVLSNGEIEQWGVTALKRCADDFLGKPFDVAELIARINSNLRRLRRTNT